MVKEWYWKRVVKEKHRRVESAEGGVARRVHNPKVVVENPPERSKGGVQVLPPLRPRLILKRFSLFFFMTPS